jgi:alkylation response protein AidB-like acyl-CoA dehydrogenase
VEAAHAKKFSTRVTESGIASCMQVMGANGARRDHPLPRHLAASRLTHYVDGATEIQDVVISRSLLD